MFQMFSIAIFGMSAN